MAHDQVSDRTDEAQRIRSHVSTRLAERFPDAQPDAIHEAVHRAWTALSGARLRDYLEILVERDATALLRARPLAGQPLPDRLASSVG